MATSETNGTVKCPRCGGQAQAFTVMCGPRTPGSDDLKCTTGVMRNTGMSEPYLLATYPRL
jgi:hypothetical protein